MVPKSRRREQAITNLSQPLCLLFMQALRVAYLHLGRDRGIASSTASKLSVKRDHHTCSVPNEHVLILPRRRTVALNEDVTKTVEVVGREVKTDANESIVAKDVQTVDPDGTDNGTERSNTDAPAIAPLPKNPLNRERCLGKIASVVLSLPTAAREIRRAH